MGAIKSAINDVLLTFMWVFCSSMFGLFTSLIATALGVQHQFWASLFITTFIVFVFVFLFGLIAKLLGGASFNPTGTAAFYAAGFGEDNLFSMALRFPAQVQLLFIWWVYRSFVANSVVFAILCFYGFRFLSFRYFWMGGEFGWILLSFSPALLPSPGPSLHLIASFSFSALAFLRTFWSLIVFPRSTCNFCICAFMFSTEAWI